MWHRHIPGTVSCHTATRQHGRPDPEYDDRGRAPSGGSIYGTTAAAEQRQACPDRSVVSCDICKFAATYFCLAGRGR